MEEKVYSVTMTEEELKNFSEFLYQKNFINVNVKTPDLSEVTDSVDNISRGVSDAGKYLGYGIGALGAGIAVSGAAGAYSRVRAARIKAKREAEDKYKKSDKKNNN